MARLLPALLLTLSLAPVQAAGVLAVGDPLPAMTLEDQHGSEHRVGEATRLLLFAPDQDAGEVARDALEGRSAEDLAAAGIAYVADISAMPGLVTRLFALPKMREYSFPVLLGREPGQSAHLPRRPGRVTVLEVQGGALAGVRYAGDAEALGKALE